MILPLFLGQTMPGVRSPAPDVLFQRPDGTPFRLSSLRGKMVVLEFTAYRCAPCLEFAPKLEAFARTLPKVVFLSVATGPEEDLPKLAALRPQNARTILLQDPYQKDRAKMGVWKYGNVGTPTMFLITPKGNIGSKPMQGGAEDLPYLRSRIAWITNRESLGKATS